MSRDAHRPKRAAAQQRRALRGADTPSVKLSPPRLEGVVPRERLFRRLDELLKTSSVWVAAPAGAGKTTLVASYAAARRLSCIWYQVDAGDTDLPGFFHHLGLAVRSAAPRYRRPLPRLTPEYLGDVRAFARNVFREIGRRFNGPTLLVFDNFQDGRATHDDVLRAGVEELPPHVRTVFISRSDPAECFARLRANRQLSLLDWSELRLREEESIAVAHAISRGSPQGRSAAQSARLHRQCEGWMAGLILLMEGAPAADAGNAPLDSASVQPLFDYFAAEVFSRRPADEQEFLLETALFPAFTAEMARRLTGHLRARAVLDHLVRQHLFTERHHGPEPTYQFHPLFRDFLREQGRSVWDEAARAQRLHAAATILESTGQGELAQQLFIEAGDAASAARVILSRAPSLAETGRLMSLESAILQLPETLRQADPWLIYWLGVCRVVSDLPAARPCFEEAYRAFRKAGDVRGSYLAWAGIVDTFVYLWGDCTPLRGWIAEFESLQKAFPQFPDRAVEERAVYAIFTAHVFAAPEWDAIHRWLPQAERLARESADSSLRILMLASLALYLPWVGELGRFDALLEGARTIIRSDSTPAFARLNVYGMEARSALLYGEARRTCELAREARRIAVASGVRVLDRVIAASLSHGCAQSWDVPGADAALAEYRALIAPGMRLEEALWYFMASHVELLRGDLPRALERGRYAFRVANECSVPIAITLCGLNLARILIECEQLEEAGSLTASMQALARALRSRLLESECLLVLALLARRQGDDSRALDCLRPALEMARTHGFRSYLSWNPRLFAELFAFALEHDVHVATVVEMIRANRLVPEGDEVTERWPWPVRVRVLGGFELSVRDEPVRFSTKTQKKPLELLQALIALGGRAVPEEQLTERLWPESEGDAAHRVFDTTLHRLRKLLASEQAVVVEGGRVTLDSRYVWVDAWAFERRVDQALEASDEDALRLALRGYTGPFLGRDATGWMLPMRARLHSMYLRSVERLGQLLEAGGRVTEAIECYRRGIEADPLAEVLYCQLMACFERLGRTSEVLATYQRLRAMLASQLGIEPSAQARELHERVRSASVAS